MGELKLQREVYGPPVTEQPVVLAVTDLLQERLTHHRHNRWLARLTMSQAVEPVNKPETPVPARASLRDRLQKARQGDQEALCSIRADTEGAVWEAAFAFGNITASESEITEDGVWTQYGQSHDAMYRNTLTSGQLAPEMLERSKIESLNWHRQADCARAGLLEDNYFVEFSLAADDQPAAQLIDNGFFVPTMSLCARLTTVKHNKVETKTAFLAGMRPFEEDPNLSEAENLSGLEQAITQRYDITAVRNMYSGWGVANAHNMSVNELLATPLLISKALLQNGVADLACLYDQHVAQGTFFGGFQPAQSYETFEQYCAKRQKNYTDITDNVARVLLKEAPSFTQDYQANQRMQELVGHYVGVRATWDTDIDVRSFNTADVRVNLTASRVAWRKGDMAAYLAYSEQALAAIFTVGCGIRAGARGEGSDADLFESLRSLIEVPNSAALAKEAYAGSEKDSIMKCVKCPLCKRDGVDAHIKIQHANRKKVITCSSCKKSKEYDLAA